MAGRNISTQFESAPNPATRRALFDLRRILRRINPDQWNDLRVPLSATNVGAARQPTFKQWRDDGAGSVPGLYGQVFPHSSEREVFFDAQLPHSYKEGTRIAPHVHFSPLVAPADGETVRFGLEYTWANVGGVFPTTTTIYAEYTFDSDVVYAHLIGGFDPDIDEPTMKVSAMIGGRLFRDALHVNDTHNEEIVVHEIDFHFLMESFGSEQEFSK